MPGHRRVLLGPDLRPAPPLARGHANLRFELIAPDDWGDPERIDVPFTAEFRSLDEPSSWNGWAVQIEVLGWIA